MPVPQPPLVAWIGGFVVRGGSSSTNKKQKPLPIQIQTYPNHLPRLTSCTLISRASTSFRFFAARPGGLGLAGTPPGKQNKNAPRPVRLFIYFFGPTTLIWDLCPAPWPCALSFVFGPKMDDAIVGDLCPGRFGPPIESRSHSETLFFAQPGCHTRSPFLKHR